MRSMDEEKLIQNLSKYIKEERGWKGLSQDSLGWKSGVSKRAIQDIEAQIVKDPRLSTLLKLARGLGVSLEKMVKEIQD